LRAEVAGPEAAAEDLGRRLAEGLLDGGGAVLLDAARERPPGLGDFQS
jgi:hypothetical protein